MSDSVVNYIDTKGNRNVEFYSQIRKETEKLFGGKSRMMTTIDHCYFFEWLIPILSVKNAIEIGVFTGSSSLAIARGLPKNGRLIAIDINEQYTDIAQKYWRLSNVDNKVDLRLNGGINGLNDLLSNKKNLKSFDFAFVDAIKQEYIQYHDKLMKLVKIGGYIVYDNTIWHGAVANNKINDPTTVSIRKFNDYIRNDKRLKIAQVYFSDGVTFCRKISD